MNWDIFHVESSRGFCIDVPLRRLYVYTFRCGRSRCKYVDPFICRWMTATGKIANNGLRLSLHHRNVGYVAKRAKICIRERRRCGELRVRVLFNRRRAILTELWNGRLNLAWSWDQDMMRRLYTIEYNWTPSLSIISSVLFFSHSFYEFSRKFSIEENSRHFPQLILRQNIHKSKTEHRIGSLH